MFAGQAPFFAYALLADVFLLNSVTSQPLSDFFKPYFSRSNIDYEFIFLLLGRIYVKAIWN